MKNKRLENCDGAKHQLVCPECGNQHRFIEVMAEEAHLVDGHFNYIKLLEATVDHYMCIQCGKSFQLGATAS